MTLNLATILRESTVEFPERPAVVFGETVLTYRALDGAARRFAGALAGLGVRRGQHVALLLPNVPQFTVAYFAAHVLGAPRRSLSTSWRTSAVRATSSSSPSSSRFDRSEPSWPSAT